MEGELVEAPSRVVSGSVLGGRRAEGPFAYLGRYHLQVSALPAGGEREFFGWLVPGVRKFSLKNVFASSLTRRRQRSFSASLFGGHRALLPIGSFEQVMPLDILPYFLLRALAVEDIEQAEALGCLELDEEDLALCTFVCPGKGDYGAMLRKNLETIEREG
jgi:Na+-transporting NADH:ubiquinone oxidoreductase subunit A